MWEAHLRGEETSLNPLGLVEALIGAMDHAASLDGHSPRLLQYTAQLRAAIHALMVSGRGTRDLCGPSGLTTEQFVDAVAEEIATFKPTEAAAAPVVEPVVHIDDADEEAMLELFKQLDTDGNGHIDFEELKVGLRRLNVLPKKMLPQAKDPD
jgi:isocitrate dehydrogenase